MKEGKPQLPKIPDGTIQDLNENLEAGGERKKGALAFIASLLKKDKTTQQDPDPKDTPTTF